MPDPATSNITEKLQPASEFGVKYPTKSLVGLKCCFFSNLQWNKPYSHQLDEIIKMPIETVLLIRRQTTNNEYAFLIYII
jgi:hypothetical protein